MCYTSACKDELVNTTTSGTCLALGTPSNVTLQLLPDKRIREAVPGLYSDTSSFHGSIGPFVAIGYIYVYLDRGLDNPETGAVVMHGATLLRMRQYKSTVNQRLTMPCGNSCNCLV